MLKSKNTHIKGNLILILCTLIWGTSFVVLKNALNYFPTAYVLALRFSAASLIMFLVSFKKLKLINLGYLKQGFVLGIFLFLANYLQTLGLSMTTPGKSAFLSGTYCVFVPFILWVINKIKPNKSNIIAAFVCLCGIGFTSLQSDFSINMGDILTVSASVLYGLHIIYTAKYVHNKSITLLSAIQFGVIGVFSFAIAIPSATFPTQISMGGLWSLIYMGLICTAICFSLQTLGQKFTSPTSVAIIMSLEAVFGLIFSVALGYENLSLKIICGFILIITSIIISEVKINFSKSIFIKSKLVANKKYRKQV